MKYLIIENGKAFYCIDKSGANKKQIDHITKEDILRLIELCLEDAEFEMDEFSDADLHQKAHQIIYKNIYSKLNDISSKRISFEDEITKKYKDAIEKYSLESKQEKKEE